jgi:predicted transposase YbfD/YdcC
MAIVKFYISSAELNTKPLLTAAREYWSVENNSHWQLDVCCFKSVKNGWIF